MNELLRSFKLGKKGRGNRLCASGTLLKELAQCEIKRKQKKKERKEGRKKKI